MTKKIRNILIGLFGIFAFLFAGFYLVGCGVDYSKISITTETENISLQKGESQDIYFQIENYQDGFEKYVNISERSGNGSVANSDGSKSARTFEYSTPTYLSNGKIKVTITGVAGGNGVLSVETYDGFKQCSVNISVTQYAEERSDMKSLDDVLYVSDDVDLVPDAGLFEFDANITYKELSYYTFEQRGSYNLSTYKTLMSVDKVNKVARFTDGRGGWGEATIEQFDSVRFDGTKLIFSLNGIDRERDFEKQFSMLTVYDYCMDSSGQAKEEYLRGDDQQPGILYVIDDVYVLPKLQMSVSGAYNINDRRTYQELEDGQTIVIVPNNEEMSEFIVRIAVDNTISDSDVKVECYEYVPESETSETKKMSSLLVEDYTNYIEEDGDADANQKIRYWRIVEQSKVPVELELKFVASYDLEKNVVDDKVNASIHFVAEHKIAPTTITVNGSSDPYFTLYNSYADESSGSVAMEIDVSAADYPVSPTYEGVYFTYDASSIYMQHADMRVDPNIVYSDLSTPFYIRAVGNDSFVGQAQVVLHLTSDILPGIAKELALDINCNIVKGAQVFRRVAEYETREFFYIDYEAPAKNFENVLYADAAFKSATASLIDPNGLDVAEFIFDTANPYTLIDDCYYLNFQVVAKATGIGYYKIVLDNGISTNVPICCIKTLKENTTSIKLTENGKEHVSYYSYSRRGEAQFDNVLNLEILNPSDREDIIFGSKTIVAIEANETNVDFVATNDTISVTRVNAGYEISTNKNGDVTLEFMLTGENVIDYAPSPVSLNLYVEITSYSLLDEFYFMHGENYANKSNVYYGEHATIDDNSLVLSAVAKNDSSTNFYKYNLTDESLVRIFEEADAYYKDLGEVNSVDSSEEESICAVALSNSDIRKTLVHETFDRKFIYYYAKDRNKVNYNVTTQVTIRRVDHDGSSVEYPVILADKGLMFTGEDFEYELYDEDGNFVATYSIQFTNSYSLDSKRAGLFDLNSLTYSVSTEPNPRVALITAIVNQRGPVQDRPKTYDMEITPVKFRAVESISLASNMTKLNFSSSKLTYTIGVYTYPTTSTNKAVNIQFIKDSGMLDQYSDLLTYRVDDSQSANGVYMITISCEDFYNKHKTGTDKIENITCPLAGTLYIYPKEWGNSYTVIGNKTPVTLAIQYRNGSKANPYLLESAEDVMAIGLNEVMLKSHYEINSVIDMSSVQNFKPIGAFDDGIKPFKGTIIGSSSQASITNITISNDNFAAVVENKMYGGLFAELYVDAIIENVQFTGRFNFTNNVEAYVGIVAAKNSGKLINSGVTVRESEINSNAMLYLGGLAGINLGEIYQDFMKYSNEEALTREDYNTRARTNGETELNKDYAPGYIFKQFAETIQVDEETGELYIIESRTGKRYTVDEDGYQLYSSGQRAVFDNHGNLLPEVWAYVGQTSKNLANYVGFVTVNSTAPAYIGGVVGNSNGGDIRRFLADPSKYNMYGYSGYSAYAQIKVVGSPTTVYLGGIVGSFQAGVMDNLLVGGEVDSSLITTELDSVGGLVGIAVPKDTAMGTVITANTIRTFVRGKNYVGGIAGQESVGSSEVRWGRKNTLEAVDDGRTAFYSAMIIKYKYEEPTNYNYAVGYYGSRDYGSESGATFNKYTYLNRAVIVSPTIDRNNNSTEDYYGNYLVFDPTTYTYNTDIGKVYEFVHKDVEVIVEAQDGKQFDDDLDNVFFMYYFGVDGYLDDVDHGQTVAQDQVAELNFISTNSTKFYPFKLLNSEVTFSSAESSILSFDANQNITVLAGGLARVSLISILNINTRKFVYVYVVNYFNKDVEFSLYYTSSTSTANRVTEDSIIYIYGDAATSIYVVPDYELQNVKTVNGNKFSITSEGILSFANVSYKLSKNSLITSTDSIVIDENISNIQTNKQTIVFKKETADETKADRYLLTPMLKVSASIDGVIKTKYYRLDLAQVGVNVEYREAAKSIRPGFNFNSMETNNTIKDLVVVDSTNANEKLFYQIFKLTENGEREIVQNKLPLERSEVATYVITIDEEDLFDLQFALKGNNIFEYTLKVNRLSEPFRNRAENNIYGEYVVILYASQLTDGVTGSFRFRLDEAHVNYISLTNHSDSQDISLSDQIMVPAQAGLLEIAIDPVEASFNRITISNNARNYADGAGIANFTFVYEQNIAGEVSYIRDPYFAQGAGEMSFTYAHMKQYLDNKGQKYVGKVYIEYLMPAYNVEDGVIVGFDVAVEYGNGEVQQSTIELITKLSSYARLRFADRQAVDGGYYVARGLSYEMALEYYGYIEEEISIEVKSSFASISKVGGKYYLNISNDQPSEDGRQFSIITRAVKIVDDKGIPFVHTIDVHIMEYVLNYAFVEGVNEDIVKDMKNGVIDIAIGNPYTMELSIDKFIEYNRNNSDVKREVAMFIEKLSNNVTWTVYLQGNGTELQEGRNIRTDFYTITYKTYTPLKLYDASSRIYYFTATAYFEIIRGGLYDVVDEGSIIHTEFSFDVHQQSTEESPLPIETYEEFIKMSAGEWYILMQDIVLPDSYSENQFMPISEEIAGLDGNSHNIIFMGTYNYSENNAIGVFEFIGENSVIKNLNILIARDTVFGVGVESFNFGLLTAENRGVVTNCCVRSVSNSLLSVEPTQDTSGAYVAGLVATNMGYITHSRSQVNIITSTNLAGFVAQNQGHIASSYFMGASLENTSTSDNLAGFVLDNSGSIYTSYTSGDPSESNGRIYYYGTTNTVKSVGNVAGFVFDNTGIVADCYSNVNMSNKASSGSDVCGFVYENSGSIARCFSTSLLPSYATKSFGFVKDVPSTASDATFEDCYYLSDIDASNGNLPINQSIEQDKVANVVVLSIQDFSDMSIFNSFVVAQGRDTNSVWFYSTTATGDNFNGSTFSANRIELVAPNIVATSIRVLDHIENVIDTETGVTYAKYVYVYTSASPTLGSMYNPIVIYDYKTMEENILGSNNRSNQNYQHIRLVKDIDYSECEANSNLFNTKFMGYLEANFVKVQAISLISNEHLDSAGLFAEIGSSNDLDAIGTVMNISIIPNVVSFSSTTIVGGLAGKIDNAHIINVNVKIEETPVIVIGQNVVGGVIGFATGNYKMQNVYANVGARASYVPGREDEDNQYDAISPQFDEYSFAGTVAGILAGNGKVYNSILLSTDEVAVVADKAGLLFGLATSGVEIERVNINVNNNMVINAYSYGGFVIGQSYGTLIDVHVYGNGLIFENFKKIPHIPTAIGGIVGLLSGGQLNNVSNTQSIKIASYSDSAGVRYFGGIVGRIVDSVQMRNVSLGSLQDIDNNTAEVSVQLSGLTFVGGLIGGISNGYVKLINVTVVASLSAGGRGQNMLGIGGVVGFVDPGVRIDIFTSNDTIRNTIKINNLNLMAYYYGDMTPIIGIGSIVGQKDGEFQGLLSHIDAYVNAGDITIYEFVKENVPKTQTYDNTKEQSAEHIEEVFIVSEDCTETLKFNYTVPLQADVGADGKSLVSLTINTIKANGDGGDEPGVEYTLVDVSFIYTGVGESGLTDEDLNNNPITITFENVDLGKHKVEIVDSLDKLNNGFTVRLITSQAWSYSVDSDLLIFVSADGNIPLSGERESLQLQYYLD